LYKDVSAAVNASTQKVRRDDRIGFMNEAILLDDGPAESLPPKDGVQPLSPRALWAARLGTLVALTASLCALFWPKTTELKAAGMLVDTSGQVVTLGSQFAPVTLLHFWATWCPPCIDEVPAIRRLSDDYANNHQFALVMVAVQDDPDVVKTFLEGRFKYTLFDPQWQVARRYGTEKVPETFLVVNGKVVESFIGATNWDDPRARQQIDQALAAVQDRG